MAFLKRAAPVGPQKARPALSEVRVQNFQNFSICKDEKEGEMGGKRESGLGQEERHRLVKRADFRVRDAQILGKVGLPANSTPDSMHGFPTS